MNVDLMLLIAPDSSFDIDEIYEILNSIDGINRLKKGNSCIKGRLVVTAYFTSANDSTYIELSPDHKRIDMNCQDEVALQLALEINRRFERIHGTSLRIFDVQYTLDQSLGGVANVDDLRKRIDEDPYAGSEQISEA